MVAEVDLGLLFASMVLAALLVLAFEWVQRRMDRKAKQPLTVYHDRGLEQVGRR